MPPKPKLAPAVAKWLAAKARIDEEAKPLVEEERLLRKLVVQQFFPRPRENTNIADCGVGGLKLTQPYKRTIDEALLDKLRGEWQLAGIPVDDVFYYVPKLNLEVYRALPAAQRKKIDKCLTITLDSPTLAFVEDPA